MTSNASSGYDELHRLAAEARSWPNTNTADYLETLAQQWRHDVFTRELAVSDLTLELRGVRSTLSYQFDESAILNRRYKDARRENDMAKTKISDLKKLLLDVLSSVDISSDLESRIRAELTSGL